MQLSEQEIVRRKALEQIRELGVDPFPPEKFDVNYKTTDFASEKYKENLVIAITQIDGVSTDQAIAIRDKLLTSKFKTAKLLDDENFNSENKIGEKITVNGKEITLEDFLAEIRVSALGDFSPDHFPVVQIAGRFMGQRGPFAKLQDGYGTMQVYLRKNEVGANEEEIELNNQIFKLLHIGDFIGITGHLFATQTGEVTVKAKGFKFLGKSLRNLPIVKIDKEGNVHDEFTDPEMRYRQRYVDLTVNPRVKDIFLKRTQIINSMRNYFNEHGWLEVETPVLQPIHGGAAARPFATHHNTLDMPLYLRIANELYLKRLIVGGFDGVYEFGKMFRNEGMDRTHNPEFTSMEIYVAYKDYKWMMEMVETCLERVAKEVTGSTAVPYGEYEIDFAGPYERLSMYDSIKKYTGIDVSQLDEAGLRKVCADLGIHVEASMGKGKLIDEIFGEKVEDHLIQPTYITDYPIEMTPLAKKHRTTDGLVERFELFVNGKEIANAYSELNDPIDQRERFEEQLKLAARGDDEAMVLDEDFLRSLEYGMPPSSGLGIGIDRLTMLLTNQYSIQEVIFFPQMKPEAAHVEQDDE